jgi:E-phenylitaconyl-CoA hydratase
MLATDIRIATPDAKFGLSEVKRGIVAANGGTQRIAQQLPYPIAMEMLLGGGTMDADRAAHFGLVNKVVPREDLMAEAQRYAENIAANAPLAVQASKELAVRSRDVDTATGLRLEQMVARTLRQTEDAQEGRLAFIEKRQPKFTGQ